VSFHLISLRVTRSSLNYLSLILFDVHGMEHDTPILTLYPPSWPSNQPNRSSTCLIHISNPLGANHQNMLNNLSIWIAESGPRRKEQKDAINLYSYYFSGRLLDPEAKLLAKRMATGGLRAMHTRKRCVFKFRRDRSFRALLVIGCIIFLNTIFFRVIFI